jgi:hypothetical protein
MSSPLFNITGLTMARTASVGIRIEPHVKGALAKAAEADRRSMAAYIELLLIEHLRAAGFLPGANPERRLRSGLNWQSAIGADRDRTAEPPIHRPVDSTES